MPQEDILHDASTRVNRAISYIRTEEHIVCPSCINEYLQLQRIKEQKMTLLSRYTQNMKKHKYNWNIEFTEMNTNHFINEIFNPQKYSNDDLYLLLTKPIRYRRIDILPVVEDYNNEAKKVMGVTLPNDASLPILKPNIIACPSDGVGLIKFPRSNDFLVIEPSNFDEKS